MIKSSIKQIAEVAKEHQSDEVPLLGSIASSSVSHTLIRPKITFDLGNEDRRESIDNFARTQRNADLELNLQELVQELLD